MGASKAGDFYGLLPGHSAEIVDAEQAYTQSTSCRIETWVRLPTGRWPASWIRRFRDPVVRLQVAVYGRPDSGGYWEHVRDTHLKKVGFIPATDWRGCFSHGTWALFLGVYVDAL